MTPVPLPASPCVRVSLAYNKGAAGEGGNRFYLSYSGSAPTGANCVTLAGDIATAWADNIAGVVTDIYVLEEVDVLDIATDSGLSGQWTGTNGGSRSGTAIPDSIASNVEFGIARRYRGGKPRMYLPPGVASDLVSASSWTTAFVGELNSAVEGFFTAIAGLSVGAMGTLAHVNLSYYSGFRNVTNSSGRERAVPVYRDTALVDTITGYSAKSIVGSQRRRRTATTV